MPDDKRICASVIFDENRFVRLNKNLPVPAATERGGDGQLDVIVKIAMLN